MKFSWSTKTVLLVTCILSCFVFKALSKPIRSDKSGEEQVKDAVRKAEAAASLAAEDSVKRDNKPSASDIEKINKLGSDIEDDSSLKEGHTAKKVNSLLKHATSIKDNQDEDGHANTRVKEHRVHRKPLSHLLELGDLGSNNGPSSYKEDTKLEDRLALEAEEEKKYEDGYGGNQWEDGPTGGSKGGSWSTNIQRQDAAEKQSIQAQVASESAHELNEIQQAVAAESQSSRGATSLGDAGASVVQIGHNEDQSARFREEESSPRGMEATASFEAPRIKSFSESSPSHMNNEISSMLGIQGSKTEPVSNVVPNVDQDISSILRQSTKLSQSEMQGPPKQFSSENIGNMGSFGGQSVSRYANSQENIPMEMTNSFAGSEAGQNGGAMQLGGQGIQEVEQQQKEAYPAGALQGATMEGANMQQNNMQSNPIEIGGNAMQGMPNMGSLAAGFTNEQQQQPLVAGMQGIMGGAANMQSLGAAAANGLTGMQAYGNLGAQNMGGLQSFAGGMPMTMGYKKRSKTAKVHKDRKTSGKKQRNMKKNVLSKHHSRQHPH